MPPKTGVIREIEGVLKRLEDISGLRASRGCKCLPRHIGKCEDDDFLIPWPSVVGSKCPPWRCNKSRRSEQATVDTGSHSSLELLIITKVVPPWPDMFGIHGSNINIFFVTVRI